MTISSYYAGTERFLGPHARDERMWKGEATAPLILNQR